MEENLIQLGNIQLAPLQLLGGVFLLMAVFSVPMGLFCWRRYVRFSRQCTETAGATINWLSKWTGVVRYTVDGVPYEMKVSRRGQYGPTGYAKYPEGGIFDIHYDPSHPKTMFPEFYGKRNINANKWLAFIMFGGAVLYTGAAFYLFLVV